MIKRRYFIQLFAAMLTVVLAANTINGYLQYKRLRTVLAQNTYDTQQGLLDRQCGTLNDMFSGVTSISRNLYNNTDVNNFFHKHQKLDAYEDVLLLRRVITMLGTLCETYEEVDNIILYDFNQHVRVSSRSLERGAYQYQAVEPVIIEEFNAELSRFFWFETAGSILDVCLDGKAALVQCITNGFADPSGVILTIIDCDKLGKLAQRGMSYGSFVLTDSTGALIAGGLPDDTDISSLTEGSGGTPGGRFSYSNRSLTYAPLTLWIFTDTRDAALKSAEILRYVIISALLSCCALTLLALVLSRAIYKPIKSVSKQAQTVLENPYGKHMSEVESVEKALYLLMAKAEQGERRDYIHKLMYSGLNGMVAQRFDIPTWCNFYLVLAECEVPEADDTYILEVNKTSTFFMMNSVDADARLASLLPDVCIVYTHVSNGLEGVTAAAERLRALAGCTFAFTRGIYNADRYMSNDLRSIDRLQEQLIHALDQNDKDGALEQCALYRAAVLDADPTVVDYRSQCLVLLKHLTAANDNVASTALENFDSIFKNVYVFFNWLESHIAELPEPEAANDASVAIPAAVEYAIKRIENDYDTDLALSTIADEVGLSEQYLSKLFSESTGMGFKDRLTQVRLARACEMLESGLVSVNDVALRVGYSGSKQFIRVFKKYKGVTPGAYSAGERE